MAKGMDTVLANAMNGLGAMPAKGMCMTCSEDDMRTLIDYLVEGGQ
jgi:cytochrome c5